MSSKTSSTQIKETRFDALKWVLVCLIVAAGVIGNAYYSAESLLYRVLALVVLALVAGFIALQTAKGAAFWKLLKEARVEIRKVVWPTRAETRQTTLIVLLVVVLVGLVLWGLDSLLSWAVSGIIG